MDELVEGDPIRVGPYELLGILGSGGMGRVYLGSDADGGLVAVKVIHSDLAREPEFRRRFGREIEALRAVSGPGTAGIAAILDADADAARPWLATEHVAGPSLHHVVAESGVLDTAAVRTLGAALARTLAAIHAAQLVHRDIKPTNLLLPEEGPKLIDFGIARDLQASTITRTGLAVGTPQFMAPEQLDSGHKTGTAADVFALAGLLVFAVSGRGPFGDGTPAQLLYAVVHSDPDLGRVPAELRPLLSKCLNKDPDKRPTAARVAEELERPPGALDPNATVPVDDPRGGPGGRRRAQRAALVGAATFVAVAITAVVMVDGQAAGSNSGSGHSAKGAAFPTAVGGTGGTSTSDTSATSGAETSPTAASTAPGSKASAPSSVPSSISGPGSPSGSAVGGTSGGPGGGPTGGTSDGGPGPTTAGQPSGTQRSNPVTPTSRVASPPHTPPSTSHAPSPPPSAGGAPGSVTGVAAPPASPFITMTVSWSADPGATSYVVKYTESLRPGSQPVTATGTSVTLNVIPQETVCIQVQAVNSAGASAWSPSSPVCVLNWTQ
ncbi:protein kinase [Catenulispora sp. EB89]|uniref:protein kinase domain-containing protein n=1 Tax=Catenulispora sp. EB89 TaxID=3156257 RepID=UPI0035147E3D